MEPFSTNLTASILARTSGSACPRLHDQACAHVDGELNILHEELIQQHLEHCPACRDLIAALQLVQEVLPTFSRLEPGPAFTRQILKATSQREAKLPWWQRLLQRPRVGLELAYAGTLAGVLVLQVPDQSLLKRLHQEPALVRMASAPKRIGITWQTRGQHLQRELRQQGQEWSEKGSAHLRHAAEDLHRSSTTWLERLRRHIPNQDPASTEPFEDPTRSSS